MTKQLKTRISKNNAAQDEQNCPNCGMSRQEWRGNNGEGFQMGDKMYCCQGCATSTGCTCR
ncbi:MAG TPA: hypothetical protein VLQ48_14345 [Chloroflexia bacterium]|nr:hypothetical protein [Chloroflexia bacterium]